MGDRYQSFLVRCWPANGVARRVRIEHVQTGDTTTSRSLDEALQWMERRLSDDQGRAAAQQDKTAHGEEASTAAEPVG